MKRRSFVTLLGGAAATWPLATTSIPILAFTDDMVGQGFVNSELVGNPAGASVSIKALELRCPSDRVRNGSLSTIGSSCQIAKFSSLLP
jgi:hypothetical protein